MVKTEELDELLRIPEKNTYLAPVIALNAILIPVLKFWLLKC